MYPAPAYPRATRSWLSWATSAPRMPSVSSRQAGTLPYSRYVGTPLFVRYRTWPCRIIRPADGSQVNVPGPDPGGPGDEEPGTVTVQDPAHPSAALTAACADRVSRLTRAVDAPYRPAPLPAPH